MGQGLAFTSGRQGLALGAPLHLSSLPEAGGEGATRRSGGLRTLPQDPLSRVQRGARVWGGLEESIPPRRSVPSAFRSRILLLED